MLSTPTATNMTKQWTLPLRGKPADIIDVAPSRKRRINKFKDTQQLGNEPNKSQMEVAMLKLHQKELIRQLLGLEFERDQLKNEVEAMRANNADTKVASLAWLSNILIQGIHTYASKLAQ